MEDLSAPLLEFLEATRAARCFGVRTAGDGAGSTDQVELNYVDPASGAERTLLLRAELRDGRAVLVLEPDARLSGALRQVAG